MTEQASRILIVDDERLNVDLLEQELGDRGFETEAAYGGKEALDKVAVQHPDLILLDVMMPDIDGITVCRMLKEDPATALIPIVIMTALDATEDRVRGIEAGADDFLTKPVDDRELLARIKTALKTKQAVDSALDELESASVQLDRLGSHEEELSVLVVELRSQSKLPDSDETFQYMKERYRASFADLSASFSGDVVHSEDNLLWAVVRPADHARLAFEAAQAIRAETEVLNRTNSTNPLEVAVGVGTGTASVGSARVDGGRGSQWTLVAEGDVIDETLAQTLEVQDGEIVLAPETQALLADEQPVSVQEIQQRSGLRWPAEYGDLQAPLIEAWEIEDLYLHRVLSGKSGALVYAVDITCRKFRGQAILKFTDHSRQSYGKGDEATRHREAFDSNKAFSELHLPKIVNTFGLGHQSALLFTIAARGLEYSLPWEHCPYGVQVESGARLARELLEEWNVSYGFAEGVIDPSQLLTGWLDYRTRPEDGGRIHALLTDECGVDPKTPTFIFEGHWYPNPLAFALHVVPADKAPSLRAIEGNHHGDLHGYNLLVSSEVDPHPYYLIDLLDFRSDSYLLFDHAYFELSHLLIERGKSAFLEWLGFLDSIDRGAPPRADDVGLLQLVGALRAEVAAWIDRHEPNRLSYLDSQARLARVAAGLSYSHKNMDVFERLHALLYAAHALKSYLKFHNVDWPRTGEILQLS